jgi:hypothetical protein
MPGDGVTRTRLFWIAAAVHCTATLIVVLTVMAWEMWLLDTGHREAPLSLRILSIVEAGLAWPLLYPLARLALAMGFADPLAPIYWPMVPLNSATVALVVAGTSGWLRRRRPPSPRG